MWTTCVRCTKDGHHGFKTTRRFRDILPLSVRTLPQLGRRGITFAERAACKVTAMIVAFRNATMVPWVRGVGRDRGYLAVYF